MWACWSLLRQPITLRGHFARDAVRVCAAALINTAAAAAAVAVCLSVCYSARCIWCIAASLGRIPLAMASPKGKSGPSPAPVQRSVDASPSRRWPVPISVQALLANVAVLILAHHFLTASGVLPAIGSSKVASSLLRFGSSSDAVAQMQSSVSKLSVQVDQLATLQQDAMNLIANALADQRQAMGTLSVQQTAAAQSKSDLRFTMDEFHSHLAVYPIHQQVTDPAIAHLIDAHDYATDERYKNNEAALETLVRKYQYFLDMGGAHDKRFYVKYMDEIKGFGLFTSVPIRKGDVLGEYTGVLTNTSWTTDYVWNYPSQITDPATGKVLDLGIDAKLQGNWFRFVNDGEEEALNCEVAYVPYNKRWRVVYVASQSIAPDHEILISYGSSYWNSRIKVLSNGERVLPPEGNNNNSNSDSNSNDSSSNDDSSSGENNDSNSGDAVLVEDAESAN